MELQEKIDWLDGAIWSRTEWLEAHGAKQKWPEHDIEAKKHGLTVMMEIRSDYQRAMMRRQEHEAR